MAEVSIEEQQKRKQKLLQSLGVAKMTMEAVESGEYKKGNFEVAEFDSEDGEKVAMRRVGGNNNSYDDETPRLIPKPQTSQYRNLETTKLPKAIVDTYMKNPINIDESILSSDFRIPPETIERVKTLNQKFQEYDEPSVRRPQPTRPPQGQPTRGQQMRESVYEKKETSQPKLNINEESLRRMIKDIVYEVAEEIFDKKMLGEQIQLKIGNTVFSGNLRPLKRK